MLVREVHFKKFSVLTEPLLKTLPQYKPKFWPLDWTIVIVKGDMFSISKMVAENAVGLWDVMDISSQLSKVAVGFEDEGDAVVFKLSYVEVN